MSRHLYLLASGPPDDNLLGIAPMLDAVAPDTLTVVCDQFDVDDYDLAYAHPGVDDVLPAQGDVTDHGEMLQWLVGSSFEEHVFIADARCKYFKRDEATRRLTPCDEWDIEDMLSTLDDWLSYPDIPIVGISAVSGNEESPYNFKAGTRQCNFYGVNVPLVDRLGIEFNAIPQVGDLNGLLSTLLLGYNNKVTFDYAWSGPKLQDLDPKNVARFRALHPHFVTAIEDEWDDPIEPRILWGAALKYGRENHRWKSTETKTREAKKDGSE